MSWETQLRKGILELAVLNALKHERLYGYDLVRTLRSLDGLVLREGTLYPILSRLRDEGLVKATVEESHEGPARKYYALTRSGKDHLQRMNAAWDCLGKSIARLRDGHD